MEKGNLDQQHPQASRDRLILENLLNGKPDNYNMAELARLRIRYLGFPGARDIKADLDKVLVQWNMTEEELFEKTRQIHSKGKVYRSGEGDREDWI